ncbi:ORF6N domain-containing protein [Pectobacterium sp. A535-S3-A17]|uniref:ORF6N domain-containing protein n=1 Tax=Pectobacterium quasiaquaticum TaxID=2774015 RepID=UPI001876094D|nr:ORF6N domain-containing protein [Pectobacterium quasiaquaticum]MBE5224075.1 ORF6N domain-containing protein [Pectobacterium quasiaquaticum]
MTTQLSVESLPVIVHAGVPVITTELMASLYCTERQRITNNFNRNKNRFVVGKHYFKIEGENLESLRNSLRVSQTPVHPSVRALMLWTERGAARHAKMLETDQAWEVFEKLEDFYFSQREKRVEEPARKTKQSTAKQLTPLRQTVERLITSGVGNIYPDIWKLVHKRFDIENIQQLQPDQINEAIDYLDALEGEYIQRGQQATKTAVAPIGSRRVLLYLDANGSVTGSLPIAPDELVASWNTFAELARREGWIVARKEDFAAKLSNLFI